MTRVAPLPRVLAWSGIVLMCLVGVFAAFDRAADTVTGLLSAGPWPDIPPRGQRNFEMLARALGVETGTRDYAGLREAFVAAFGKFNHYPGITLLHVITGGTILVLAPLQFSARVRSRYPRWHRWTGRALLVLAIAAGFSGMFFGLFMPYGGAMEASAVAVFGGFLLFAAVRAYLAIRRRDIARHREWVIRLFAIALGVVTMRVMAGLAVIGIGMGSQVMNPRAAGVNMWVGWLVTLAVAELWIRRSRARAIVPPELQTQAI